MYNFYNIQKTSLENILDLIRYLSLNTDSEMTAVGSTLSHHYLKETNPKGRNQT